MDYHLHYAFKIWITTAWAGALSFPAYLLLGPERLTDDLIDGVGIFVIAGLASMVCSLLTLIPFALSLKHLSKLSFRPRDAKLAIQFTSAMLILANFALPALFIDGGELIASIFFTSITASYVIAAIISIQFYSLPETMQNTENLTT